MRNKPLMAYPNDPEFYGEIAPQWFQGRLSFLRGIRLPLSAAHSPSSAQGGTGGPVARMSCRGPFNELAIV
jgi:hypothetical protein